MPQARIHTRISEDGLSAYVSVTPGPSLDAHVVLDELAAQGVTTGLLDETTAKVAAAIADPTFHCEEVLVAVGQAAVPPVDAFIDWAVAVGLLAGHVRDDGSMDYHDREFLKPLRRGDEIGKLHAPIAGIEGIRVDGSRIGVAVARKLGVRLGSGVEVVGECILATRDGVLLFKAGQALDVVDHHVHQGHVDRHCGNLNMQGSLAIKGDVVRPFQVSATGDLEIQGNVVGASVVAGGSLRARSVRGGARANGDAKDSGSALAEHDMALHHAESADLRAGGTLHIEEAVNCQMLAERIEVKNRIRGGRAIAESQILVKEAGAPNGVDTWLMAGEPLELPTTEAQRAIATMRSERLSMRARGGAGDREKGGKIGRARAELDAAAIQRLAERARRREALIEAASIHIAIGHPGVCVRIGNAQLMLDEPTRAVRISFDQATATLRVDKTPSPGQPLR